MKKENRVYALRNAKGRYLKGEKNEVTFKSLAWAMAQLYCLNLAAEERAKEWEIVEKCVSPRKHESPKIIR